MQRRTFIRNSALLLGAASAPSFLAATAKPPGAAPILRIAHITDTHVFDERNCPRNMEAFFTALAAVKPAPDLVLHTGDVIMDATGHVDRAPVDRQWKLWRELSSGFPIPINYCLGNHDIWAGEARDPEFPTKRLALEQLSMDVPYYAFSKGGWRFLMLDSVLPAAVSGEKLLYSPRLDERQLEWLRAKIETMPATAPLVICSHVPILSASIFEMMKLAPGGPELASGGHGATAMTLGAKLMHNDTREIQALLRSRKGVTLCLSGHLHLIDKVVYDGLHYFGAGAVCGDWWRSPVFHQSAAGFALFDLHPDGNSSHTCQDLTWSA